MLNPMHLKTFLGVLRTGSFSDAGRELGYSASAVSQQMSALERSIGVQLFEREAHSVRPTAAAEVLSAGARDVLAALLQFEDQAAAVKVGERGRVRMASFPSAGAILLPRALEKLLVDSPGIEVLLDEGEPETLLPRLLEGDLDVMLAYEYNVVPRTWPTGLTCQTVLKESLILAAPSGLAEAKERMNGGLVAFADEHWVSTGEDTGGATCLKWLCAAAGFSPRVVCRSNNYDTVIGIVGAGLGVALVPALAFHPSDAVVAQELDPEVASRSVLAVYRTGNTSRPLSTVISVLEQVALSVGLTDFGIH